MSSVGILGKKLGMTQIYDTAGVLRPVTVVEAQPNVVTQLRGKEKEGYQGVQLAVFDQKPSRVSKQLVGHFKKAGLEQPKRFVREFRTEKSDETFTLGDKLTVERIKVGMWVDVIGQSKGKSFQGVVRKHGFAGQGAAHGSKTHRRNGAIGERSTPGRVYKNQGMPGHMGDKHITVQNLEVIQVRPDDHLLLIQGAVPGANGSFLVIRPAIKGQPKPKKPNTGKGADKKAAAAKKK